MFGVVLMLAGQLALSLTTGLAIWLGSIVGLLAVAQIAHLALKGLVDTDGLGQG